MSDAERYLQRAVELEQIANECFSRDLRGELLSLAADWRHMAAQAEMLEQRSSFVGDRSDALAQDSRSGRSGVG